jgi:hypothetical protein
VVTLLTGPFGALVKGKDIEVPTLMAIARYSSSRSDEKKKL